jgi:DNA adenine methylase
MLSTWDNNQYRQNPYITSIWGEYQKVTQEHFYFVGAKESNRNAMIEALLMNYAVPIRKGEDRFSEQLAFANC